MLGIGWGITTRVLECLFWNWPRSILSAAHSAEELPVFSLVLCEVVTV